MDGNSVPKFALFYCQMISLPTVQFSAKLIKIKLRISSSQLTKRKNGLFRILKPFIDLKSQTHTRHIFQSPDNSDLKSCGGRED